MRLRSVTAALVGLTVMMGLQSPAYASVSPTPNQTVNFGGPAVFDLVVLDSGRVILGGLFTSIGPNQRSNVGAVLPTGTADTVFAPTTNGEVRAVAASEDGSRVFIGGTFTEVNGAPRQNLAAVDAITGQLIESWQADTTGTVPTVKSLAVHGDRLYVGGKFDTIDGASRQKLAVLDVATGGLVPWNTWVNGNVNEVRVSPDGATVWVGGSFTRIRGVPRSGFGAIEAGSGLPTAFDRAAGGGGVVITVAVSDDGNWAFASTENNTLFAYQPSSSNNPVWAVKMSGNPQAIAASSTEVYMGGHFAGFNGGLKRPFLASVNLSDGAPTSWDTKATGLAGGGWALVIDGNTLHAGGQFTHFNGVQRRLYAQFAGTPTP